MGLDRAFITPTITVDQDKYDNLIKIQDRYEQLVGKENIEKDKEDEFFDFGLAIRLIKAGRKVQRQGWNGKNQYIELATNISYVNTDNETINAEHDSIGNKAIAFVGTSGVQIGWLASQADMLANDWKIVDKIESEENK